MSTRGMKETCLLAWVRRDLELEFQALLSSTCQAIFKSHQRTAPPRIKAIHSCATETPTVAAVSEIIMLPISGQNDLFLAQTAKNEYVADLPVEELHHPPRIVAETAAPDTTASHLGSAATLGSEAVSCMEDLDGDAGSANQERPHRRAQPPRACEDLGRDAPVRSGSTRLHCLADDAN